MKSEFYMTTGNDQLSDWTGEEVPKYLPKPKLHKKKKKKKITVTVWWTTAHLILYSFLNPGKTVTSEKYIQQIDGMHRKLELPLVNSMGPILLYNSA